MNNIDLILIITGVATLFVALITEFYSRKTYDNQKSPKIVIEAPFNDSLHVRNIGNDTAKNIKEITNMFRDIPFELWNFNGPIDYIRIKSPNISKMINFHDQKLIQPSNSVVVRFEYENSDGNKFYSEIRVERGSQTQQIYFYAPNLVKWDKVKKMEIK